MNSLEFSKRLTDAGISSHLVVPFDAEKDRFLVLDLSPGNKELTDNIWQDITTFGDYIDQKLRQNNARYGIGGYGELRNVYSASSVFDGGKPGDEPRRFHLGTDIWGELNTAVFCPLDGIVHSYAFNNGKGDYGATIILAHRIADLSFYTLYGHLSLNSIKNLQPGERVKKGDVFAEFGIPAENGQWPSHLHFQIILNIENWKGDYPGVCKYSEREEWLANSPDPSTLLQLNQYIIYNN